MITFNNWEIACPDHFLAHQHDNLSHQIRVVGEVPTDYTWEALLQVEWNFDILPMQLDADGLYCDLTAGHLATEGHYQLQLRGTRGEEVKHTNQIRVYVPGSLSGDTAWPEIPSAFKKYEARLNDAADKTEQAVEDVRDGIEKISESQAAAEKAAAAADRRATDAFYYMGESNQLLQGTAELKHQADASASNAKAYADGGDIVVPNPEGGFKVLETVPGVKGYMEQAAQSAEAASGSASTATSAATVAAESAEAAAGSEARADDAARKAEGFRSSAGSSATRAERAEAKAADHAAEAEGHANTASKQATWAGQCNMQAEEAAKTAESAKAAAESAKAAAESAKAAAAESAEAAEQQASTATSAATSAGKSAEAAVAAQEEAEIIELNALSLVYGGYLKPHGDIQFIEMYHEGAEHYANAAAESARAAAESAKAAEQQAQQGSKDAVQYVPQELTDAQKAQARANIGAAAPGDVETVGAPGAGEGAEVFNAPDRNTAIGKHSHAEGFNTNSEGDYSHAEGVGTDVYGYGGHVEGYGTVSRGVGAHAQGRYNVDDVDSTYAHIVGNGRSVAARSNAHTVDWDGNAWFAGKVFVGGTGQNDPNAVELGSGGGAKHWDDLEGRPFYSEFVTEEIFAADRLSFSPAENGAAIYETPTILNLTPGRVYTVSWAGEEFQCEAKAYEGETGVVLGECGSYVPAAPSGNGEPFGVAVLHMGNPPETLTKFISHNGVYNGPVGIRFEGEVVKTIDPKYLPEGIGSGSGDCDWDIMKNKPFYTGFEALVDTTLEIDPGRGTTVLLDPLGLIAGQEYTVAWNGTEYVSTARTFSGEGVPMVVLGDLGMMTGGTSTGEPFIIAEVPPEFAAELGASVTIVPLDDSTSVTLVISGEVVKTIDPKYLPEYLQFGASMKDILPECQLMGMDEDGDGVFDVFPLTQVLDLTVGETYAVNYNGSEYTCVAQDISALAGELAGGFSFVGLGNVGALAGGADTGEPFVIMYAPEFLAAQIGEGVTGMVNVESGTESVTLSIKAGSPGKLDPKYLPDGLPYVENLGTPVLPPTWIGAGDGICYTDAPFGEVKPGYTYKVTADDDVFEGVAELGEGLSGIPCTIIPTSTGSISGGIYISPVPMDVNGDGSMMATAILLVPEHSGGNFTLSISAGYKIHKIDERCLPDSFNPGSGSGGGGGGSGDFTETDPTVPDWAKQPEKPTYTAEEVGAISAANPVFTGSISMGRKAGSNVGSSSVALGLNTTSSGDAAHAEGHDTTSSGFTSHAEGKSTTSSGEAAHAEGKRTTASGEAAHAEGLLTIATSEAQHVQGKCNIQDSNNIYAHVVGNGSYTRYDDLVTVSTRSNAHTLDWDGNAWFAGDVYVGSTSGTNRDAGSKKLATVESPEFTGSISLGRSGSVGERSFAVGMGVEASGAYTHAEGAFTKALGSYGTHAEGFQTTALDLGSHAEGYATVSVGTFSHAEGANVAAFGVASHAEGDASSPEDVAVLAYDSRTRELTLEAPYSLRLGEIIEYNARYAYVDMTYSDGSKVRCYPPLSEESIDNITVKRYAGGAAGQFAHSEGWNALASEDCSHAEGYKTTAYSNYQHVQGKLNVVGSTGPTKLYAHIVGNGTETKNEAGETVENRSNAHTLDWDGNAWFAGDVYVGSTSGTDRDAGSKKLATEEYVNGVAMGNISVAAGVGAAGTGESAEVFNGGAPENASGIMAHAEGLNTIASGFATHAEGQGSQATNFWSHAEGYECRSTGLSSHAEGMGTIAASSSQHAEGSYNIEDADDKYLHIAGNGTTDTNRSNAHTLDWRGNAWFAGTVEGTGLILKSPSGKRFLITVDDSGNLSAAALA